MILRQSMLMGLNETNRGNGARNEDDADRIEFAGRQGTRRKSGPETMPIPGHDSKSANVVLTHEIINFSSLSKGVAMIFTRHVRIPARPSLLKVGRQVLQIRAPFERPLRVAPQL